jgi:DNA-binding transcriptional ArsR family regulator
MTSSPSGQLPALPDDTLAAIAKALAHPARIHILRQLLEQEQCIAGDLALSLPLAQSTVSEHLRVLREAGLVSGEVAGPRRCYCANRELLAQFSEAVGLLGPSSASAAGGRK